MKNNFIFKLPACRIFTIFALAALAGLALASFYALKFDFLVFAIITLTLLFAGLLNFFLKNYWLYLLAFALIFFFAGISYFSLFDQDNKKIALPYDQTLEIDGKIVKRPDVDYNRQQATIEIVSASLDGNMVDISGALLLAKLPHYPSAYYGDRLRFTAKIEKPAQIEDFDYAKYLRRFFIYGIVSNPSGVVLDSSQLNISDRLIRGIYTIPARMEESLNRILPEPQASLAAGILIGAKRNMPDDFKKDLSTTGLTHIVALSGYNITIIVAVFSWVLLGFVSRKWVFLISLAFIVIFVFLTGVSSSVLRAAIFSMMIVFGRTYGKAGDMTNLMLLAALSMVLVNPYLLVSDLGFQLSFLAFAGLIYLSPILNKVFSKTKAALLPEGIYKPLIETLSAQMAVFPLLLTAFGTISIIGPIANLFVIWIIPYAMLASLISAVAGVVAWCLGKATIPITWPFLEYIVLVVQNFAKVPFAAIQTTSGYWIIGLGLYLLMLIISVLLIKKYKLRLI